MIWGREFNREPRPGSEKKIASDMNKFEAVALAITPNAVLTVVRYQNLNRARPLRYLVGLAPDDGSQLFQQQLPSDPLPDGLLVDRDGRIVVTLANGGLVSYGRRQQ